MTVSNKSHRGRKEECRFGRKAERELTEVNIRAMSRGHNTFISRFKMVAVDFISIGGGRL